MAETTAITGWEERRYIEITELLNTINIRMHQYEEWLCRSCFTTDRPSTLFFKEGINMLMTNMTWKEVENICSIIS